MGRAHDSRILLRQSTMKIKRTRYMGGGGKARLEAHKESSNCYLEQHDLQPSSGLVSAGVGTCSLPASLAMKPAAEAPKSSAADRSCRIGSTGEDHNRVRKRSGTSAAEDVDLRADSEAAGTVAALRLLLQLLLGHVAQGPIGGWWLPHRRLGLDGWIGPFPRRGAARR